jgi:Uma2 family endonuclease
MADPALDMPRFTSAGYLELENDGAWKHEFVNGVVYAMSGASRRHNAIAGDFFSLVNAHLSPGPCQAFALDMKVHIKSGGDERYYYPDLFVTCAPDDRDEYASEQPVLIVEVMSASTEHVDRGAKLTAYTSIPTLQEYVLVSQDTVYAEVFRRKTGWSRETYTDAAEIVLDSISLTLPLPAIYRRVSI